MVQPAVNIEEFQFSKSFHKAAVPLIVPTPNRSNAITPKAA
jgi:hypothetical protein